MAAVRRAKRLSLLPYILATVVIASALFPWPELITRLFSTVGFEPQWETYGGESRWPSCTC